MRVVIAGEPEANMCAGLPRTNLFAMHAWAGDHDRARAELPAITPLLAQPDRQNTRGQWVAATMAVGAFAIFGDRAAARSCIPPCRHFRRVGSGGIVGRIGGP